MNMKSTFATVIDLLKENTNAFSIQLGENSKKISVSHENGVVSTIKFDQNGEWFLREITKNGKAIMTSEGNENSVSGALNALLSPKEDLQFRVSCLKPRAGKSLSEYDLKKTQTYINALKAL